MYFGVFAQSTATLMSASNDFIINNSVLRDPNGGVIYFNEGSLAPGQLFSAYKGYTGLGENDRMDSIKTWVETIGECVFYHTLYQQMFESIEVEGAQYTEHHDGVDVWQTSGFLAENLSISIIPTISEASALTDVMNYCIVKGYLLDSNFYQPAGVLVLALTGDRTIIASNYKLSWRFDVRALNPSTSVSIYVDASNHDIISEIPLDCSFYGGQYIHDYYGVKYNLDTRIHDTWFYTHYHLFANEEGRNIFTTDNSNYYGKLYYSNVHWGWEDMPYATGDNIWNSYCWSATNAHECASRAWDYFYNAPFSRNGMSGWGKHLRVVSDYKNEYNEYIPEGAMWVHVDGQGNDDDYILVSRFNGHAMNVYDVIGHEFTHGINFYSRKLKSLGESGALMESFGDIFGTMIEKYAKGMHDWEIGADAQATIRIMDYPNLKNHPSFYNDSFWKPQSGGIPDKSNDWWGIHINAGVLNKWFYLLSTGGFQDVNGQIRDATSIGEYKASRIAYTTLTSYITANSNYNSARAESLAATALLYGLCSNEYNAVCRAWWCVNVGDICDCAQSWRYSCMDNIKPTSIESINYNNSTQVNLYPNPASDAISIAFQNLNSDSGGYYVEIYSFDGKKVYGENYNKTLPKIDISNLSSGLYLVKVSSEGKMYHLRLIKK